MHMDKESGSGFQLPWSQGILVALLFGLGSFFMRDAPYVSDHRADTQPRGEEQFTGQDVDARLWQDPLGVVQRARDPANAPVPAATGSAAETDAAEPSPHSVASLRAGLAPLPAPDGGDFALVLAVMVRGGPYADFVEQRRRSRYAILSGLNEMGYEPADADHLGWVGRPRVGDLLPAPGEADVSEAWSGMVKRLPEAIPYEWFNLLSDYSDKAKKLPVPTPRLARILVLWLDDRAFTERPVTLLQALARAVTPGDDVGWRIIGPLRSDALRAMVLEPRASFETKQKLHFYAATPTVPDEILMGGLDCADRNCLTRHLEGNHNIEFFRTVANDSQLARSLIDELQLRGLRPTKLAGTKGATNAKSYASLCRDDGAGDPEAPSHIAVVAEWDTLYGRSLRKAYQADYGVEGYCVEHFSYMRGLDGMLPGRAEAAPENEGAGAESSGGKDDDRRKDGSFIERAEGQSQFDYLRRLAKQMHDRDDELRRSSPDGKGLRAIGILGNDLHDKLLVMQALRPEFPAAQFFTNDLDARYLHPREQQWTRNLLVASSFGFRLDRGLQGGVPPFRDGYETSQFFATRLLVDDAWRALTGPGSASSWTWSQARHRWMQARLDHWLGVPRIFEIGRTRAFDFAGRDPDVQPPEQRSISEDGAVLPGRDDAPCFGSRWQTCDDIHPPGSERAPIPDATGRWFAWLLLSTLWIPILLICLRRFDSVRRYVRGEGLLKSRRRRRHAFLAVLALLAFIAFPGLLASVWPAVAEAMTKGGKPLVFTEGVSTWPTEFIRLFTFLLGAYLLLRAWSGLVDNQHDIERKFFLKDRADATRRAQAEGDATLTWRGRLVNMFRWSSVRPDVDSNTIDPCVETIWRRHAVQNRLAARLVRTAAYVALTLAMTGIVYLAFREEPFVPQRGLLSLYVHKVLHYLMFPMLYFVVFFVVDATALCVSFVRYLREKASLWPEEAVRHFANELRIRDENLVTRWIGLRLVEERTAEINQLVYYPFILLSLVLLSRSPVFDVWQMPTSGKVLAVCGAVVAMLCAAALRWSAEKARRVALEELDTALLRANAPPDEESPAGLWLPRRAPVEAATPRQIELLREQAAALRQGAFAPYSQQPVLKALMLPFATLGGTSLLEYLQLANM
jgi:hypothetical protein